MTAVREGSVAREGFALGYTEVGAGEPLVMLAGGPGLSAEYLQPVARRLADHCRCILVHPRGTGRSQVPVLDGETINFKATVDDLEALRESLNLTSWMVLGHSFGGMWAMAYAAAFPARVQRLALAAPGGPDLGFFAYFLDNILARLTPPERETLAYWMEAARVQADPDGARHAQARASAPAYFWDRRFVPAYQDGLRDWFHPRIEALLLASLFAGGYDVKGGLRAVCAPTLIVQGRQDPLGDGLACVTQTLFPQAELTFLDRCGHYPWAEQPEAFHAALRAFLAS